MRAVAGSGTAQELLSVLTLCEGAGGELDRVVVDTAAGLDRQGAFAERGYRSPVGALSDLLGVGAVRGPSSST